MKYMLCNSYIKNINKDTLHLSSMISYLVFLTFNIFLECQKSTNKDN